MEGTYAMKLSRQKEIFESCSHVLHALFFLVFVRGEDKWSNTEKFVSYIEMKSRLREMNPIISIAALHPATLRD
jgi:hypothetical protein